MAWVVFKLFAEASDMDFETISSPGIVYTPDGFGEAGVSYYLTGMLQEMMEDVTFGTGKTYLFFMTKNLVCGRVKAQ